MNKRPPQLRKAKAKGSTAHAITASMLFEVARSARCWVTERAEAMGTLGKAGTSPPAPAPRCSASRGHSGRAFANREA